MTEENLILNLKDKQCVNTYLIFLQDVISRMGTNSGNIKALISVIYTILITVLIGIEKLAQFWWLCIIIVMLGMLMDSYYLAFERMYRKKYNKFVDSLNNENLNEKEIFNMNPKNTDLKYEMVAEIIHSAQSFSIIGFYIILIVISIFIKFM